MNIIKPSDLETPFRVGVVVSKYNEIITQRLYEGAIGRLNELKVTTDLITVVWVPGAVEIPLAAQALIDTGGIHVVITLGAVIKGDTDHFTYVCEQVSHGCQTVALENGLPVIFGVLTCPNEQTALERAGGSKGNVGRESVDAAFDMLSVLRQVDSLEF